MFITRHVSNAKIKMLVRKYRIIKFINKEGL